MNRNTINTQIRRSNLLRLGLCSRCGQASPAEGSKCCQACIDRQVVQTRLRRERLAREGLCAVCGKEPHKDGAKCCQTCLKRKSEYAGNRAVMLVAPEPAVVEPVSPDEVTDKRHEYPHCQWAWTFSVDCPTIYTMAGGEWETFGSCE